jgi:hypothetical protein
MSERQRAVAVSRVARLREYCGSSSRGLADFGVMQPSPFDLPTVDHPAHPDRGAMMPRREQSRDQDRRDRINAERRLRRAWLAANYEPPPF